MILAARALAIGYPGRVVGRGFEFELRDGEVLALLGPNGGGKTTLLKTLLGLIAPKAGSVTLDGRPLTSLSIGERARRLGYVPQSLASAFAFTVAEFVLMGRTAHGGMLSRPSSRDHAIAAAAIERLGIASLADRPISMISGGERQMALIARALAQEPSIILFDEPTASLDLGNQGKVLNEIRRLAAEGLSVMFTTHDPNHARRVADRALLIGDGEMRASGPASEVIVPARLAALYNAPIVAVVDPATGAQAFLPG